MSQNSAIVIRDIQNKPDEKMQNDKLKLNLNNSFQDSKATSDNSNQHSVKTSIMNEDDLSNIKKSSFSKNHSIQKKMVIDFNKKELSLQDSEDQQALIQILKKENRNKKEVQFIDRLVSDLKFFNDKKTELSEKLYGKLLEKLKYQYLEKEKPLFFHGDKGDKYYIVLKGQLILLLPPKPFEEQAVIDQTQQMKSKEKYYRLKENPQQLLMRHSHIVSNFEDDQINRSPNINSGKAKTQALTNRFINTALKFALSNLSKQQSNSIQSPLSNGSGSRNSPLSASRKQSLGIKQTDIDAEKEHNVENIFDLYCLAFYPNFKQAFTFNQGAGFGEIALIRKTERSGTVVSKEDCHLMTLDKDSFDEILGRWERQKTDEQLNFLRTYAYFKDVNEKYLMGLLHSIKQIQVKRHDIIYKEGENPDNIYFIKNGEIELSKICKIQKTETLQQQLDKEDTDELIRGNNTYSHQQSTFKTQSINQNEQLKSGQTKKNKLLNKNLSEKEKNDRKVIENGTRLKFSVIPSSCYFGEQEILIEIPFRNHMAKVVSTSAELWIMDRKSFYQLLKQQRTFKDFQNQCQEQISLREQRLQKISSTMKKEEDKFLINVYKPKHQNNTKVSSHSEQNLIQLLKSTEEESQQYIQDENIHHNNQKFQHNYQNYQNKDSQTFIANDQSFIKEDKLSELKKPQKLLNYFSNNGYLEKIEKTNSKKMQILKEISQKGIGFNGTQSSTGREVQPSLAEFDDDNFTTSRTKHTIPFQKNLLFQPGQGNGIRKGVFRDPFQTYDDFAPYGQKGLKTTSQSLSNLLIPTDKKRNTLHNLYSTQSQINLIKPIIEKFEREQLKSGQTTSRQKRLKKQLEQSDRFMDGQESKLPKQRNSLRLQSSQQDSQISLTHLNQLNEDQKFSSSLQQNPSIPDLTCESMKTKETKFKYPNIQEIVQDNSQKFQVISQKIKGEQNLQNEKKNTLKIKSDTQLESEYILNNNKDSKQKKNLKVINIGSVQHLQKNQEEEDPYYQSKGFRNNSHSLAQMSSNTKNSSRSNPDKSSKNDGYEKEDQNFSSYYQIGNKIPKSYFQDQFSNQSHKKTISTLNLNASEHVFDSFKILMTEEDNTEQRDINQFSPQIYLATSPSQSQFKNNLGQSNSSSNIHMNKLRQFNQNKQQGHYFSNIYNKPKSITTTRNLFFKESFNNTFESAPADLSDFSKQVVNNAFKTRSLGNPMFKKTNPIKKN